MNPREARLASSSRRHALLLLVPLALLATALLGLLAQSASAGHDGSPPPTTAVVAPAVGPDTTPTWTVTPPAGTTETTGPTVVDGATTTVTIAHEYDAQCVLGTAPATDAGFSASTPTCSPSFTSAALSDGTHVLSVRTVETTTTTSTVDDGTGTAPAPGSPAVVTDYSSVTSAAYRLDTTDPLVTVTGPAGASYTGWTVAVTDASNVDLVCTLHRPDGSTAVLPGSTCNVGTVRPTLSDGDGPYSLSVVATDEAGNEALPVRSADFSYDGTAPSISLPDLATDNETSPTWSFTVADAVGTPTCSLTGPGVSGPGTCTAGSYTAAPLSQPGTYTLTVTATDAAGNPKTETATYELDLSGPTVAISPAGTTTGSAASVSWTVTLTGAASSTCAVDGAPVICTGPITGTPSGDGAVTLTVSALDAYGNPTTDSATYVRDSTVAFTVTAPAGPSNDRTPTWTFAAGETVTVVSCVLRVDGVVVPSPGGTCDPTGFTPAELPTTAAAYVLEVTVRDALLNEQTFTSSPAYVLDTTARPLTLVPATGQGPTDDDSTPAWTVSGSGWSNPVCTFTVQGSSTDLGGTCSTSGFSAPELGSTDGTTYVLTVSLTDPEGNVATATTTYVLDTSDPTVSLTPATRTSDDTSPTWTIGGAGYVSATCELTLGETVVQSGPCSSLTSHTASTLLDSPGADYLLTVTVTDAAGNTATATASYRLDTVDPTVTITPTTRTSDDTSPTWTIGGVGAVSATCQLTLGAAVVETGACDSMTSHTASTLPDTSGADYVLTVVVTDAAGNTATTTAAYRLDTMDPTVTVSPTTRIGSDTTPTWTIGGTGYVAATCELADGATVVQTGSCASLLEHTATTLPGSTGTTYTLTVTVTDAAGNTAATSATYLLDTAVPTISITPSTRTGNDTSPTWALGGGGYVSATCELSLAGTVVETGACDSLSSHTSSTLVDTLGSDYVLTVLVTDAAVNTASTTAVYRLDTADPTVSITPSTRTGNDTSPTWTIGGTGYVSATCELSLGGTVVQTGACISLTSHTASTLPDSPGADYLLTVTVTDAAGNTATATSTYRLDTADPTATLTPATRTSDDTTPTWTIGGAGYVSAACELTLGGAVVETGPCDSLTGHTASTLVDSAGADHLLTVVVTDAAGNTTTTTATYRLDTADPTGTLTPATRTSDDTTPSWTIGGAGYVAADCELRLAGAVVQTGPCDSLTGHTATTLPDSPGADYVLTVTVTDAAGNTAATTAEYRLDTADPTVTLTPATRTSDDTTPSWTIGGAGYVAASCVLSTGDTVVQTGPCDALTSHIATTLPDSGGTDYLLTVTVTDAAGNTATTTATYRLDTADPTVTLTPTTLTSDDTTPSWTIGGAGYVAATCVLTRGGTVVQSGACEALTSHTATTLPDTTGTDYLLTVTVTDAAGNTATTTATYRLDTADPTVTVSPADSTSNETTPTWTIGGAGYVAATCVLTGGATPQSGPCDTLVEHTAAVLGGTSGTTYTLTVTVTDAAGNTGTATATYLLDTVADFAAVSAPTASAATKGNDRTPTWTFTAEPGSTVTCVLSSAAGTAFSGPCTTSGSFTPAADLPVTSGATYTLVVTVVDALGNTTTTTLQTYTLDTVADLTVALPSSPGNDRTPDWTFTTEPGATVTCSLTGPGAAGGACATGGFTADALPTTSGADYVLTVTVTDALGNVSDYTQPTHRLDTVADLTPGTPSTTPANDRTPSWSFTVEAGSSVSCTLAGPGAAGGSCTTTDFTATELPTTDGADYVLTVTVTDALGNPTTYTLPGYRLDTVADLTPGTRPTTPDNDRTPSWTFTVGAGSTVTCTLTGPGAAGGDCTTTGFTATELTTTSGADYVLTVAVTDVLGNTTSHTLPGYRLDTVADLTPGTPPTTPGNDRSPAWAFTVEAGSTVSCVLTGPGSVGGECTTTGFTADELPTTSGADYVLTVTVTDGLGNPTAYTLGGYRLDTTADLTVVRPTTPGNDRTPSWTFTAEPGSTIACALSGPGAAGGSCTTTGFTAAELPTTSGADHVLTVTLTDALGNVTVYTQPAYRLDTVADLTPGTAPATPGNDRTPSWAFTLEAGATLACALTGAGATGGECTTTGFTAAELPTTSSAAYVLVVTVTDKLGNATSYTMQTYTLDTVADVVVTDPLSPSNDTTPTWTFTTEPGATVSCALVGPGAPTAGSSCTTNGFTPGALPQTAAADYVLTVTVTDALGNATVYTRPDFHLDTKLPVATVTVPTSPSRAVSVTWAVAVDEPLTSATCELRRDGGVVLSLTNCPGSTTVSLPGDGEYDVVVTLVDLAGNPSTTTSTVLSHDATAPAAPVVSPASSTTNVTTATWTITGEAGIPTTCRLTRDGALVSDWTACGATYAVPLPGDGSYVLEVRSTDRVGSGPSTSVGYLLDTVAPVAPVVTGPTGPSQSRTPAWTVTHETGTTTECRLVRGGTVVNDWAPCSAGFTADLDGLPDGSYVLESRATDLAQNTGAVGSSTAYVLDTTAPLPPVVSGPAGPSQSRSPGFTWTGEAGTTAECQLSREGATTGGWLPCSSGYAPTLDRDGTWTLAVRLTDVAGNVSEIAVTGGYVLDTTPPEAPVVTPPSTPGRDLNPSWGAVVEGGATLECRLTGPDGVSSAWASCTLPHATSLAGRPDGAYVLEVRATDKAGNLSSVGSGTYVLDTVAPAAAVVVSPAGPSRSRTPVFTFTTEAGATTRCRLTSGTTLVNDFAPCSSPVPVDLNGLPDGTYTVTVRVTDAAGNPGPGATGTYVLDTTGPAAPVLTLSPATPSPARSVEWAFTYEPGSTLVCRLTFPTGAVREISGCASPLTVDLTGLPDGSYTLTVRAVDAAGNVGAVLTDVHVIDSDAVASPEVTGPVTPGSTRTPSWKVVSSLPTECRLTRGTTVLRDWAACTGGFTADLFGQPDGPYVLSVRARTSAGELSAAATSRYVLDTTAPGAATIVAPPTPSTNRVPTWSIASAELGATAECRVLVFGSVLKGWAPCAVTVAGALHPVDLTGLGDGTYTLVARLTDAAGNKGPELSSAYVLDTSAPVAVGITGPPTPGNDETPTWTLSTGGGATLECRLTSAAGVVSDWAPCAGSYTANLADLPDGIYTLAVRAVSEAGTPGPETTSAYELNTSAPGTPTALALANGVKSPSNNRSPSWTFTLPDGTDGSCTVKFGTQTLFEGPCSSGFRYDLSGARDGSYTLTVKAVDKAGNPSAGVTSTYVLDTEPTAKPVFTQVPGSTGSTLDPQWRFTVVRQATAQCRLLQGGTPLDDWATCASPYTAQLTGRPDGTYVLQVRAVDSAGNTSEPSSSTYVLDRSAAPVTTFTDTPVTPSQDRTVSWSFTAPEGMMLECRLVAPDGAGAWGPCGSVGAGLRRTSSRLVLTGGTYSLDLAGRPDGQYSLEVRVVDADGTRGAAASASYLLDTRAPAAPGFSETPGVGNDPKPVWLWSASSDELVECRLVRVGGGQVHDWRACEDGRYETDLSRLGQGSYALELRVTDAAGNVGPVASATYRFDTTPPDAPQFSSRPPAGGADRTISWTFTVPADTRATCIVARGAQQVREERACSGRYDLDLSGLPDGVYTLVVRYTDSAGNVSQPTTGTYALRTVGLTGPGRVDPPSQPAPTDPVPGGSTPTGPGRGGTGVGTGGGQGSVPGTDLPTLPGEAPTVRASDGTTAPAGGSAPDQQEVAAPEPEPEPAKGSVLLPGPIPAEDLPEVVRDVVTGTITRPTLPLALLAIVVLFLLAQNRIDRRDPKLAAAPVEAEPELDFTVFVRRPGSALS
jgi:hypothetical protein